MALQVVWVSILLKLLADNGVAVVCAARRMDLLRGLAERIKAKGGKALAVAMDVTDRASVKAGFDLAEKEFGTPDIIVATQVPRAVSPL